MSISITKEEYKALLRDAAILQALEETGIDNSAAYDFGMELLREKYTNMNYSSFYDVPIKDLKKMLSHI